MEGDLDFKELNINHSAFAAISPIFSAFIHKAGRGTVQIRREGDRLYRVRDKRYVVSSQQMQRGNEAMSAVGERHVRQQWWRQGVWLHHYERAMANVRIRQYITVMSEMDEGWLYECSVEK